MPVIVTGKFKEGNRLWEYGEEVPQEVLAGIPLYIQKLLFSQGALQNVAQEEATFCRAKFEDDKRSAEAKDLERRIDRAKAKIKEQKILIENSLGNAKAAQSRIDKLEESLGEYMLAIPEIVKELEEPKPEPEPVKEEEPKSVFPKVVKKKKVSRRSRS